MLERSKNIVRVKKVHGGAVHNVLKKFTGNTGKRYRSIIFYITFVTLFK